MPLDGFTISELMPLDGFTISELMPLDGFIKVMLSYLPKKYIMEPVLHNYDSQM